MSWVTLLRFAAGQADRERGAEIRPGTLIRDVAAYVAKILAELPLS